jgi:hypothetical protein
MLWNTKSFLPSCEPSNSIHVSDFNVTQLAFTLENLSFNLPHFLKERRVKEELVHELRMLSNSYTHGIIDRIGTQNDIERAFLLLSLFACSYSFGYGEKPIFRVPKEISIPLFRAAHLCGRHPVLTYTSYVLYNWKKTSGGEFQVINTFTDGDLEKSLITVFLGLETKLAELLSKTDSVDFLEQANLFLTDAVRELRYLRAIADVDDLAVLAGYYCQFDNIFYEGACDKHVPYTAEVFSQCTIFPVFYKLLGIDFKDALLAKQVSDLSGYRHPEHNKLIGELKKVAVQPKDTKIYNECIKNLAVLHNEMFMLNDFTRWSIPRIVALDNSQVRGTIL